MDKGRSGEGHKIIVDASVVSKWIIQGEPWDGQAKLLEEKIANGEIEAYAPSLITYEVASVLYKSILKGNLETSDGAEALTAIGDIGVKIQKIGWNETSEILKTAIETNLTVYDAAYIYLSKKLDCKLVTADQDIKMKGKEAAEIIMLGDLPDR